MAIYYSTFVDVINAPATATVIAVVGILLAMYIYQKQTKRKKLVYVNKESVLIGEAHNALYGKLKVTFSDRPVNRVTRSIFVIWNAGRETIRGADIAVADPLRIDFPAKSEILLVKIERNSREAADCKYKIVGDTDSGMALYLSFDFLDYRDGMNVSVVHSAAEGSWSLNGSFAGMPDGVKNWGPSDVDLEGFRTPKKSNSWYMKLLISGGKNFARCVALCTPPVVFLASFLSTQAVAIFPSLGHPDTFGVMVPGEINFLWLFMGSVMLLIEFSYFLVAYHRPPKNLT